MKDYMKIYEQWLADPYFDEDTKNELRAIADDENEIKERFYMDLEFGTAGPVSYTHLNWYSIVCRLQRRTWHQKYSRKRWGDGSCRQKKSVIPVIMIRFI